MQSKWCKYFNVSLKTTHDFKCLLTKIKIASAVNENSSSSVETNSQINYIKLQNNFLRNGMNVLTNNRNNNETSNINKVNYERIVFLSDSLILIYDYFKDTT